MNHDFLAPLQAEASRLEGELQRLPIYRRLEAVRASIRALTDAYADPQTYEGANSAGGEKEAGQRQERSGSLTGKVWRTAEAAMRTTNRRVKSSDVLQMLNDAGVELRGTKPQAVVASILSHHDKFDNKFDSHGAGYGLKEWSEPSSDAQAKTATPEQEVAA